MENKDEKVVLIAKRTRTTYINSENGFTVARYETMEGDPMVFNAVGFYLPDTDATVILKGAFEEAKYGKQFSVSEFELKPPDTKKEFIKFISSLGVGFGEKRATKLYTLLGKDAWKRLEEDDIPPAAARIAGTEALETLKRKLAESSIERDLIRLIGNRVSVDLAEMRRHNITANYVRLDPYCLCLFGGTFDSVDEFAISTQLAELDSPKRIESALHTALRNASVQGSTCLPSSILLRGDRRRGIVGALQLLNRRSNAVSEELAHAVLMNVCDSKRIRLNSGLFYTDESYMEEVFVAKKLFALAHNASAMKKEEKEYEDAITEYENKEGIRFGDEQKAAILGAVRNCVSVITGYPGTGKTTVIKGLLYVLKKVEQIPEREILLLSPTGRAARRMEEATGAPASTVLSALGYTGRNTEELLNFPSNGGGLQEDWTLDAKALVVDEISMADLLQMAMFLRHVEDGTRVILIGDPDQLPSVGAGNVLHDIISSGEIKVFRLNKIFRQKSNNQINLIPLNAAKIRTGQPDLIWSKNLCSAFMIAERKGDSQIFDTAVNLYNTLITKSDLTVDDVALLVPYRKKSKTTPLTATSFNEALQAKINPILADQMTMTSHGVTFHAGDKVMQLVNTEGPKNGEIGFIERISLEKISQDSDKMEKVATIKFNDLYVAYDSKMMANVDLAYASSVHKMQGSETDTVILVLSNVHSNLLARNLVYTAITRAIKHVIVVGETEALRTAILRDSTADPSMSRITLLASRLHHEGAKARTKKQ